HLQPTISKSDSLLGLEHGAADLLELVTPTTAELLLWWFGQDMVDARSGLNFHAGQKQAILNAIVAHEVLLAGTRLAEVSTAKHAHPKYCFKMATGTGKTWVLQALLVWQLLNKTAALASGLDDARFTRQFIVVAPGLIHAHSLKLRCCTSLVNPPSKSSIQPFTNPVFFSERTKIYRTSQTANPPIKNSMLGKAAGPTMRYSLHNFEAIRERVNKKNVLYSLTRTRLQLKVISAVELFQPFQRGNHRFTRWQYRLYSSPNLFLKKSSSAATMLL
ncbi:MAG: DEAD/DEAH box helicase family protein, partial [Acidovorax sp.]